MTTLTVHQNLLDIQSHFEKVLQRPVYTSGFSLDDYCTIIEYRNCFHRFSKEDDYQESSFLFRYLSPHSFYSDKREYASKNEDDFSYGKETKCYCTAEIAKQISFCWPITESERLLTKRYLPCTEEQKLLAEKLETSGVYLRGGSVRVRVIPSEVEKQFPELVPYICEYKQSTEDRDFEIATEAKLTYHSEEYDSQFCIIFAHSWNIETPQKKLTSWSYGGSMQRDDSRYTGENVKSPVFTRLQAPGQFSDLTNENDQLNFPIIFADSPGRCIICRGVEDDKRHIVFGSTSMNRYSGVESVLCYTCFVPASKDWVSLLEKMEEFEPKNIKKIY